MTVELNQQGAFNIAVQGVQAGAEINITQVLANSFQYGELVEKLATNKQLFALTPENQLDERLKLSAKINSLESQIEQFKKDVVRLAKEFDRIEINTDRLRRAKEHFDKGEISAARAIFESESDVMRKDQERLLEKRAEYEENILPKLKNSAEEYLLSALLAITDYKNPNRYADTLKKFELSIKSLETKENLFQYATILLILNRLQDAEDIYERFLKKFSNELVGEEIVNIYINLGVVYFHHQDIVNAERFLNLALEHLSQKDADLQPSYKYNLAAANGNLAVLLHQKLKFDEAYQKFKRSIEDFEALAREDNLRFAPTLIDMQSNLGYLLTMVFLQLRSAEKFDEAEETYREAEESLENAFKNINLFREKNDLELPLHLVNNTLNHGNLLLQKNEFAKAEKEYVFALKVIDQYSFENPQSYLPKKAVILNSFGVLKEREENLAESKKYFEQAVTLFLELLKIEPQSHLVNYCMAAVNLADTYAMTDTCREDSIDGAIEVLAILYPVAETLPFTKELLQKAWSVMKKWNFDDEEIIKRADERMKQIQISPQP